MYTRIRPLAAYLSLFFSFFFPIFKHYTFSSHISQELLSSRRLKLGTHMNSRQMYRVYQNQAAAAAYWSLYFSFSFLSNFQTLKFFVTLFSGTVRPRRLKLYTLVDNGWMYRVYRNHAAVLICPFISSFFSLSNFHTLQFFVTL